MVAQFNLDVASPELTLEDGDEKRVRPRRNAVPASAPRGSRLPMSLDAITETNS